MATSNPATTGVRSFVDITKKFSQQYPAAVAKLVKLKHEIQWNREYAQHWENLGDERLASQLSQCSHYLSGNDLNDLRAEYYCRRPYSCRICRSILVNKRVEQWQAIAEDFSRSIKCNQLVLHRFLVRPHMIEMDFEDDLERFEQTVAALQLFRRNLRATQQKVSVDRYLENIDTSVSFETRKGKVLGPIVTTMHVVPQEVQQIFVGTFVHLHVGILTTRFASKQAVTAMVKRVWNNTRKALPFQYEPNDDEVIRWQQTRQEREAGTPKYRVGSFQVVSPGFWKGDDESVLNNIGYMAEPFKKKWKPTLLLKSEQLLGRCGLTMESLYQLIGMRGIKRKALPHGFDSTGLNHRYHARFIDGTGWRVFEQI